MSELLKSYDNAAGRTCEVRYDTAHYPRPFWVDASPGTVSTHVAPETHTGDVKFRVLSRNPKITRHPDGSVDYEFDVEEA